MLKRLLRTYRSVCLSSSYPTILLPLVSFQASQAYNPVSHPTSTSAPSPLLVSCDVSTFHYQVSLAPSDLTSSLFRLLAFHHHLSVSHFQLPGFAPPSGPDVGYTFCTNVSLHTSPFGLLPAFTGLYQLLGPQDLVLSRTLRYHLSPLPAT
jgi:hypothetical protein